MSVKSVLSLTAKAAVVATLTTGTMAAGLTVTTYTMAKANEMMFERPAAVPTAPLKAEDPACV